MNFMTIQTASASNRQQATGNRLDSQRRNAAVNARGVPQVMLTIVRARSN